MTASKVIYLGDRAEVAECLLRAPGVELAACVYERGDELWGLLEAAARAGVRTFGVGSDADVAAALRQTGPLDLGVICNFGIILSPGTLYVPRRGFVNAHLGLLPENPGRSPVRRALERREPFTGVTLHRVTEAVDAGPVLDRAVISAGKGKDPAELFERLVALVPTLLERNFSRILQ